MSDETQSETSDAGESTRRPLTPGQKRQRLGMIRSLHLRWMFLGVSVDADDVAHEPFTFDDEDGAT